MSIAFPNQNVKLVGSHAGISIGEDGPSQMGLEDLAAFRAVNGSTVLYPCDGNQTAKLVRAMADLDGDGLAGVALQVAVGRLHST
jgi:transketolase